MDHACILEEGVWRASGVYRDAGGKTTAAAGEARIVHGPSNWMLDGYMAVPPSGPTRFRNTYSIVGETILSFCRSEDGRFSGAECLVHVDPATYRNRGVACQGEDMLSAWEMSLVRTGRGE